MFGLEVYGFAGRLRPQGGAFGHERALKFRGPRVEKGLGD